MWRVSGYFSSLFYFLTPRDLLPSFKEGTPCNVLVGETEPSLTELFAPALLTQNGKGSFKSVHQFPHRLHFKRHNIWFSVGNTVKLCMNERTSERGNEKRRVHRSRHTLYYESLLYSKGHLQYSDTFLQASREPDLAPHRSIKYSYGTETRMA